MAEAHGDDVARGGPELLALALELEASGVDQERLIATLISESRGSPSRLLAACGLAQSLTRALPLDLNAREAYGALVESLRWATRHPGESLTLR